MTLFKKVFQNQSSLAAKEDLPSEDDLRKAFLDDAAPTEPLVLDPFNHAAQDDVRAEEPDEEFMEEDGTETSATNDELQELFDLHGAEVTADEDAEDEAENIVDVLLDDPDAEQKAVVEPVQSDEEIEACLGRAMAAEPPQAPQELDLSGPSECEDRAALDVVPVPDDWKHEDTASETDLAPEAFQAAKDDAGTDAVEATAVPEMPIDLSAATPAEELAVPAVGRAGRRAGRVKTRLLGFNRTGDAIQDPVGEAPAATATAQSERYPVGWLVIVEGPGVGHSFAIFTGASMIGRGEDQVIRLDFGDNSISRNNHAAIAYDEEQNKFYIGHGGKSNIIRRNARPVLSTEELNHADLVRIGETTLRFVALCGSDFQWNTTGGGHDVGL